MASLSAVIMAHPSREGFVGDLQEQLDRELPVVWDDGGGLWATGRRALLAHDAGATHHLVIQDDAIPCRDLVAGTEKACEAAGEHPISLYAGMYKPAAAARATGAVVSSAKDRMALAIKRAEGSAQKHGTPWMEYEGPWWGVALAVPTAHIAELVKWGDGWRNRRNYDARIGQFYIRRGIHCWYTMPSLVDHRVDDNPSLLGNDIHKARETGRVAHWFIGRDRSALDIDWNQKPISGLRATFVRTRTGQEKTALIGGKRWQYLNDNPAWEMVEHGD